MSTVSTFRLYLLRSLYLLIVVGLGIVVWPSIVHPSGQWELMDGVVKCMLAAFSVLALVGLRYPLQMLPILLWELLWKTLWLAIVALPAWLNGRMDAATAENTFACVFVVLVVVAVPWPYVLQHYVKKAGERWGAPA